MDDVESIERATLAAVPPRRLAEWRGWLLAFDEGTVGRCHSAVPLSHARGDSRHAGEIVARYREEGFKPVLRVPEVASFETFAAALAAAGLERGKPTLVQTGLVSDLANVSSAADCEVAVASQASAGWEEVFLGAGFDPVDGASRLGILRRSKDSVYASVREGDRTVAVGAACFSDAWCGIHGMRTAPEHRGRGLAGVVLRALAAEARARGIARCFLQTEESNRTAQALYRRAGLVTAWRYAYWQ
jgi:ribosomal protein S18 acetylase RimI-like enzyme